MKLRPSKPIYGDEMTKKQITQTHIFLFLCLSVTFSSRTFANDRTWPSTVPQSQSTISPEAQKAIELLQESQISAAIELLQQAVKKNSDDAESWQFLGVALSRQGKIEDARRAFEQSVRLRPNSVAPHNGLASCYLQLGKLREAEKEAQQALKLNPQSDEARYFLAAVRLKNGDAVGAIEEAEKAIQINSLFTAVFALKHQALLEVFSRVIDPTFYSNENAEREQGLVWAMLGFAPIESAVKREALIDQGKRFDRAIETIERSIQNTPQAQETGQWKALAESLRFWKPWIQNEDIKPSSPAVVPIQKVNVRPRILSTPEVRGISANIDASATVLVLLTADGKVLHQLITRRPGQGLTPFVLSLTDKITFAPATRDGQNVATMAILKYKIAGGRVETSLVGK